VAEELARSTAAIVSRLGKPVRPWWKAILANIAALPAVGAVIYFVPSAIWDVPVPNPWGAVLALLVFAALACGVIFVCEASVVGWGPFVRWTTRLIVVLAFLGPALVTGVAFVDYGLWPGGLAVMLAPAIAIASGWIPTSGFLRGWTIRASVNAWSVNRLNKRLTLTQAIVDRLRRSNTPLHIPTGADRTA
jgi:hypothetical protein